MDEGTWLHAQLAAPPDGLQARARGEVTVISSDGGVTIEVTVRRFDLPQTVVLLSSGDRTLASFTIAGGGGSHGQTLVPGHEDVLKDGAEVELHLAEPGADGDETLLLRGVLSQIEGG